MSLCIYTFFFLLFDSIHFGIVRCCIVPEVDLVTITRFHFKFIRIQLFCIHFSVWLFLLCYSDKEKNKIKFKTTKLLHSIPSGNVYARRLALFTRRIMFCLSLLFDLIWFELYIFIFFSKSTVIFCCIDNYMVFQ